jgi:apurinic endonuclease APN1
MKIGAHVSTRKPFSDAVTRANEIGCECMQIFANPPQRWNPVLIADSEIEKFVELNNKYNIKPVIIHGIYLVNLASENPYYYEASIKSLIDDMQKAEKIGAMGVNFHVGSTKGNEFASVLKKIVEAINEILKNSPEGPYLILENSAGAGNIIGDTLEELAQIIKAVNSSRIKVLIDTAHAFASGYDLRTEKDLDIFIEKFEKEIGLDRLIGFHFNDSKTAINSKRDRHADIGHGEIGKEVFGVILNHPKLEDLFGILETPQDELGWPKQIELLKSMRKS